MSKTKVLTVLLMLVFVPVMMYADFREHMDRFEVGVSAGIGFYVGQKHPVAGRPDLLRIQSYDAIAFGERPTLRWPGIETFGVNVGYRFNTRWNLVLQTVRQRVCFAEYDYVAGTSNQVRNVYYNPMWHVDAMAEFNILNYGNVMMPAQGIYNVVPYVGFGLGVTMYNQNATLRAVNAGHHNSGKINTFYPQMGKMYVGTDEDGKLIKVDNPIAVGLYIPVSCGVKWRINDNVQMKGTFQYQLYFSNKGQGGLNSNLEGASCASYYTADANVQNRPTFDQLNKYVVGHNHDCLFSISAIFNLGDWYEDRLITY